MIQRISKRLISLLLATAMILAMMPVVSLPAYAATSGNVTGLSDVSIGLSYTGDADNAWSVTSGTTVVGSAQSKSGTCSNTDYKSTLTITNRKSTAAVLSFDYTVAVNSGTIQVNGADVSAGGSFSKELAAGSSIKVYIKSGSTSLATKITLSNISLVVNVEATVTFTPSENGSYTVNGQAITEDYTITQSSLNAYKLAATPAAGYIFRGWYNVDTGTCVGTDAAVSLKFEENCTITAWFVPEDTSLFETGGQVFDNLSDATAYAQNNGQTKVTLHSKKATLTEENTIPAGITLLIPCDAAKTLYTKTPATLRSGDVTNGQNVYSTLVLEDGATLNVNGAVSVGGQYYAPAGGSPGYITGQYGLVQLNDSSQINVNNGGAFYAWGYVVGDGSVVARSGSSVYEYFQITDFRGGSATSGMGHKVFPFSQYFVQNIESALVLKAGANEVAYTSLYASKMTVPSAIPFVGDNGMFRVASGSLTKRYDGTTDRIIYTVNGTSEVNNLVLKVMGMKVNSKDYVLPLTNNMTIDISSGSKLTVNQDAALLAGVQATIAEGAEMIVSNGNDVIVYDQDEWNENNYVGAYFKTVPVSFAYSRTNNRTAGDLVDAEVNVNGTFSANGGVYTTAGGANICSSDGTGVYSQVGAPGSETVTYQYTQKNSDVTAHEIPITPSQLKNADGTYTETKEVKAGETVTYQDGTWVLPSEAKVKITFEPNGGLGDPIIQEMPMNTDTALNSNTFQKVGYTFSGWNTAADGTGTAYADGAAVNLAEDLTLYAQWQINTYKVTWFNWDGTELASGDYEYNTSMPAYPKAELPTKERDEHYSYTFEKWDCSSAEKNFVTEDLTMTAVYTQIPDKHTITWKNWDDTVLLSEQVDYGATPAYNGNTPTRSMDEQYRYSFKGWTPEIVVVSQDAVYTAEYNKTERVFHTVAFDANDGEGTMDGQRLEVGYETGLTANAFSRTGYTFTGWNTAADGSGTAYVDQAVLTGLTGDITLYAQWQINHYTVTWTDDNGNTLYSAENVEYGSPIPEYAGKTPAKEENAQYTYTFAGWKPEDVTTVTGDITFTPVFTGNLKQYTITWKNWDGTVLLSESVDYGTVPAYSGTPTRPGDAENTYSFAGWEPVISAVTDDAEYTAVYTATINTYTVTWKNWDGSVLETDEEVDYGAIPEYNGDTPYRPADAQYTYSFSGWAPQVDTVTGDITYTAVYQQTVNQYTVTWNDWDGTQLKSEKIDYGETPAYSGENPSRAEDVRATYTFNGWSPAISPVTGNATYTAQYTENIKSYDIVWKNEDGTVLDTKQVLYGETPAYSGETPTKEGDAQYTYTFTGWDPEVTSVTGPAVYTAVFQQTVNQYTITWKNEDGSVLKSEQVDYGTIPGYTGEAPTKEGDAQYRYSFKGWTPEPAAVTADVTYTAQYEQIVNTYKVTWVVNDVTVETDVEYGAKPSFNGEEPTKEPGEDEHCTYRFLGWVIGTDENGEEILLDDNTTVTGEMTCTAKFEKVMDTYTITWEDWDGTVLKTAEVEYNNVPAVPEAPSREPDAGYRYTFKGWSPEIVAATEDAVYTAKYEATARVFYTVIFDANGGDGTMEPQIFEVGVDTCLKTNAFTRENYKFTGWNTAADGSGASYAEDGAVINPTENITLYAQWKFQNGWLTDEIGTTYYRNGEMAYFSSWQEIDGNTYYFSDAGYIVKGIYEVVPQGGTEKERCVFGGNGVFQSSLNGVYDTGEDTYWVNSGIVEEFPGLKRIVNEDGHIHYYYFGEDGKAVKDGNHKVEKNNELPLPPYMYKFDGNGVIEHDEDTSKNGICEGDGSKFYYIDGVKVGEGLLLIDGSYYYARTSTGEIVRSQNYTISKTNGLPVEAGMYKFDEEGRMLVTGFVEDNADTYYYQDGVIAKGFTKVEDDYYFFNARSGKMYKNTMLWVGSNSYGVAGGFYDFGLDGKMITTGFFTVGGDTYYRRNLEMVKGFTKIEDDYYFFNTGSGKMYKDTTLWVGSNDYGIVGGMYYFSEDGKMVIPDLQNGKKEIISENGKLYFAIDGAYMNDGLHELNGDYYYAQANSTLLTDKTIWVSQKNDLLSGKGDWYYFGADGKMLKTGFVEGSDGYTYYYNETVLALGFTQVGDDYYFFNAGSGKMYKDTTLWVGSNDYGIVGGMYYFGTDGKMVK